MFFRPLSVHIVTHRVMARSFEADSVERLGIELAETTLQDEAYDREQRMLAVCMGGHLRLAKASPFLELPDELVHLISYGLGPI